MTNEQTYLSDQDVLSGTHDARMNSGGPVPNDGRIAPRDGSRTTLTASGNAQPVGARHAVPLLAVAAGLDPSLAFGTSPSDPFGASPAHPFGLNNERLEEMRPDLVNALRELELQYRQEGIVARRGEIRRIRQARLFWQGLQYAWWNPNDMNWHLPFEQRFSDDRALEEMPRYQFVTNFYQGFGLSFIAVLSQDVPSEITDQERASIDALNQQFLGQQQQVGNMLLPQYQSILDNPGLSPAAKST